MQDPRKIREYDTSYIVYIIMLFVTCKLVVYRPIKVQAGNLIFVCVRGFSRKPYLKQFTV